MKQLLATLLAAALGLAVPSASAQDQDAASRVAGQVEAMRVFAMIDGVWRGPAWVLRPDGGRIEFIQTERIGPFLGGSVKIIEGRGYGDDGAVRFNALGIVSYSAESKSYTLRSHALGHVGDFAFEPTGDGYRWQVPMGPATMRYHAVVRNGELHETGDRVVPGREPLRVFEMRLRRLGDSDWPAAGAVPPK